MGHYFVTGGAGFIGSHLVEHLLGNDHAVTVIDDFSTGRRENLPTHPRLAVIEADILRFAADQFSQRFDGLVHLAALPSVNDSWAELQRAHELNLTATLRVIEWARSLGIPRFAYASSAAVYGDPVRVPVQEDDVTLPLSPYGLQKLAGEHYGRLLARKGELKFVALRFFNVFGPRQVATSPYSGVISKFAASFRAGRSITINGDGSQTRDFVYVADLVHGIVQALSVAKLPTFAVCNLGTGRSVSIGQLADILRTLFPDWKGKIENGPALPGDITHSQASVAAAQSLLGYRPDVSLEAGLAKLLAAA
ncbi:MAG: NAD-dependent epimerase/dehydratase family protein [Chthoniobacterales bacterium]